MHPARIKVLAMGRRWGKTIMSGSVALAAAAHGNKVAWVAPTYKQTRPLWRWAITTNAGVGTVAKTERMIDFDRGFLGVYTADNADSMRGESFNLVIVDEAAKISAEVWTDVIQPTLADFDGQAILISTPHGRNWFWQEWQRGRNGLSGYGAFTAPSADNPNLNIKRAAELARERVSERTYRQEWLAEFVEDGGGVFRFVRERATATPLQRPEPNHTYVAGLDWALSHDYTVLTIFDATNKREVWKERFNGIEYGMQRQRIAAACQRYRVSSVVAEQNAMGKPNNDELRRMGLPVRDFTTTATTKADLIEALAAAFENRGITILRDEVTIGELESYESKRTANGGVQYNAPAGMHDDTVMSLALAWMAATDDDSGAAVVADSPLSGYRG
jgi:hypothetical protein